MEVSHLLARRAAIVARHELLESVPGSGYHADDAQARAERDAGKPPLSKRPVALHHDGRFWLVGPCVAAVREALSRFVAQLSAALEAEAQAHAAAGLPAPEVLPQKRQAQAVSARVAAETSEVIELPSNEFNAILYGLNEMKVPVVSAGVVG